VRVRAGWLPRSGDGRCRTLGRGPERITTSQFSFFRTTATLFPPNPAASASADRRRSRHLGLPRTTSTPATASREGIAAGAIPSTSARSATRRFSIPAAPMQCPTIPLMLVTGTVPCPKTRSRALASARSLAAVPVPCATTRSTSAASIFARVRALRMARSNWVASGSGRVGCPASQVMPIPAIVAPEPPVLEPKWIAPAPSPISSPSETGSNGAHPRRAMAPAR
jgi:hypothetical protein